MSSVVYFTIQIHLILFTLQELFPGRPIMRHNCMNKLRRSRCVTKSISLELTHCARLLLQTWPWLRTIGCVLYFSKVNVLNSIHRGNLRPSHWYVMTLGAVTPGCYDLEFDEHLLWRSRARDKLSPWTRRHTLKHWPRITHSTSDSCYILYLQSTQCTSNFQHALCKRPCNLKGKTSYTQFAWGRHAWSKNIVCLRAGYMFRKW